MSRHPFHSTLIVLVLLLSGGCQLLSPGVPAADSALPERVRDYLRADQAEAAGQLARLARRTPAELAPAVRRLLADGELWRGQGAPPTGLLPNQPIVVDAETMRYGLYVPASYTPDRAYPLLLCLHGAGFGGDTYLERWQPRLGEDYLLACPSIDGGMWWTRRGEALVLAVLDDVMRRYRINPDRVLLTGMSNGGLGTYLIGLNQADRFAALAPMAAPLPEGFYPLFANARRTPFYLIHGAQDEVIPVFYSRRAVDHLRRQGFDVVYREHNRLHPQAGGHFFPREELPDLVAWLNRQRRAAPPVQLTVVRDRDHTGRFEWLHIAEITPDAASFWSSERDALEGKRLEEGAYAKVTARITGNEIVVQSERVRRYRLLLSPQLVDLSRPVRVLTNGEVSFEGIVKPDGRLLLEEARGRPDPDRLVWAAVEVIVPSENAPAEPAPPLPPVKDDVIELGANSVPPTRG